MADKLRMFDVTPLLDSTKADTLAQSMSDLSGYVQTATSTTAMALAALDVKQTVAFTAPMVKQDDGNPGAIGELSVSGGGVLFPSATRGRWSPVVSITAGAAIQTTVYFNLYDENGVEVTENGFPCKRVVTLAIGQIDLAPFRTVTKPTGRTRVLKLSLSATLALNITKVELSLNKYG